MNYHCLGADACPVRGIFEEQEMIDAAESSDIDGEEEDGADDDDSE